MKGFAVRDMKPVLLLFPLFILAISSIASGDEAERKFPELKADDLNGKAVALPADFPGDPCLVLVAFTSEQQDDVDQWISKLKLKESDEIKWIELPVIGSRNRLLKPVIDRGMRTGITEEKDRARTISIYSSRTDFLNSLRLDEVDRIYAMVVEKSGAVRVVVEGTPTDEKKEQILAALGAESGGN